MKKFISVILGVVLTLGAIALTSSCKKDVKNASSLEGTTWFSTEGAITLSFTSASEFRMTVQGEDFIATGTFIITGNKSSLTGSNITFALVPGTTWFDGESTEPITGLFESESKLVIDDGDIVFNRVLK